MIISKTALGSALSSMLLPCQDPHLKLGYKLPASSLASFQSLHHVTPGHFAQAIVVSSNSWSMLEKIDKAGLW